MKWYALVLVTMCLLGMCRLDRRKLVRSMLLRTMDERQWFSDQYSIYYNTYRKSVVLYALRRLSRIFKMSLTEIDGANKLLMLFEKYKQRQSRWRRILSRLIPAAAPSTPLQVVAQDYIDARDEFEVAGKDSQMDVPTLTPMDECATVAEYVRFVVEYDTMCRVTDQLRVTSALGVFPPRLI